MHWRQDNHYNLQGYEAWRELRAPGHGCNVAFTSAKYDVDQIFHLQRIGASGFVLPIRKHNNTTPGEGRIAIIVTNLDVPQD